MFNGACTCIIIVCCLMLCDVECVCVCLVTSAFFLLCAFILTTRPCACTPVHIHLHVHVCIRRSYNCGHYTPRQPHTQTATQTATHTDSHTHRCMHTYIHTYTCTHIHTHKCTHTNTCRQAHTQMHVFMRNEKEGRKKQARSNKQQGKATQHTQACTHIYTHPHAHNAHTHVHKHTHTYNQQLSIGTQIRQDFIWKTCVGGRGGGGKIYLTFNKTLMYIHATPSAVRR